MSYGRDVPEVDRNIVVDFEVDTPKRYVPTRDSVSNASRK